jgi:hypothetical protein
MKQWKREMKNKKMKKGTGNTKEGRQEETKK